jgi:hypothetical protein
MCNDLNNSFKLRFGYCGARLGRKRRLGAAVDTTAGLCHISHSGNKMTRLTVVPLSAIVLFATQPLAAADRPHPSLLTTPEGVELAKKRVAGEAWAKQVLRRITEAAQALEKEALPAFESEWWKEASKKRWQDIYPEINLHTSRQWAGRHGGRPVQRSRTRSRAKRGTRTLCAGFCCTTRITGFLPGTPM